VNVVNSFGESTQMESYTTYRSDDLKNRLFQFYSESEMPSTFGDTRFRHQLTSASAALQTWLRDLKCNTSIDLHSARTVLLAIVNRIRNRASSLSMNPSKVEIGKLKQTL